MSAYPHTIHPGPVHSFRNIPFVPSDTYHDQSHIPPLSLPVNPTADFVMTMPPGHFLGTTPEGAGHHHRKTSTLSYQTSGFRNSGYSRSSRNLVVVIPPPNIPLDQGQLGNVLSKGPQHRLPQGILMPLFPSMFAQLHAIAREYKFPSTVGLCLYLHITEGGVTMTPRISDDSWQYLFGHLFDGHPHSGAQPPVGGSIEFDIDLNKARWFDAWLSGHLRDSDPISPPIVTHRRSFVEAHWRGEIQTINVEEQLVEDRWNPSASHTLVSSSRPETRRHLPKKLSLVDRLESRDVRVPPRLDDHTDHPDSPPTHGTYASSPILYSASPKVAEGDLEHRVNSWRANTELFPVSMAETYQPAPDISASAGATTMDEYALGRHCQQPVDIDEFLWSIASVGPPSSATESSVASSRPSSLRLDCRASRAVSPTPTIITSGGPADEEHRDHVTESYVHSSIYPAFDIYPAVYPDFHIYPAIDLRIETPSKTVSDVQYERVEEKPASLYAYSDISEFSQPSEPPQSPIFPPVEYKPVDVELPASDPAVYPYVEPYTGESYSIHIPEALGEGEYKSAKVSLALSEPKPVDVAASVVHPPSNLPHGSPILELQRGRAVQIADDDESATPPGALAEGEYESAKAFLALSEPKAVDVAASVVHPPSNIHHGSPILELQRGRAVQIADDDESATPPGALGKGGHEPAKVSLALSEPKAVDVAASAVHTPSNIHHGRAIQIVDADDSATPLPQTHTRRRRKRRNYTDLRASAFRFEGKQPARSLKTHLQLHTEVFQDGVVWTPSGFIQDLSSQINMRDLSPMLNRRQRDMTEQGSPHRPSPDNPTARGASPISGSTVMQSPQKVVFPHTQPPAERSISPLRIRRGRITSQPLLDVSEMPMPRVTQPPLRARSPGIPPQSLELAVSEAPMPRITRQPPVKDVYYFREGPPPLPPPPFCTYDPGYSSSPFRAHSPEIPSQKSLDLAVSETPQPRLPSSLPKRSAGTRLSEAVKAMTRISGRQKHTSRSGTPENPPTDQYTRANSPVRLLSVADRRSQILPPLPPPNTPPFLTRNLSTKESVVWQRIKAFEESIAANESSGIAGTQGLHSAYALRPLAPIPSNQSVTEIF